MNTRSGLIEWNPAYSVRVAEIDRQHQTLVSLIRQLQEAMLEGRAREVVVQLFSSMNEYTKVHFAFEEQLLKTHKYPELEAHRLQHSRLVARLEELEEKYATGELSAGTPLLHFLRNWLIDHIGNQDQDYAKFLSQEGVS
jgi:hemerythrin